MLEGVLDRISNDSKSHNHVCIGEDNFQGSCFEASSLAESIRAAQKKMLFAVLLQCSALMLKTKRGKASARKRGNQQPKNITTHRRLDPMQCANGMPTKHDWTRCPRVPKRDCTRCLRIPKQHRKTGLRMLIKCLSMGLRMLIKCLSTGLRTATQATRGGESLLHRARGCPCEK